MSGDDALIGQAIGGYRVERLLGEGGMGAVYLGVHPSLGKRVAVKVILRELADSRDSLERFLEEAKLASSLEHPAIVEVLDLATLPDGRPYMVMEFLDGESLDRHLRRRGALEAKEAVAIADRALGGLAAAHARGDTPASGPATTSIRKPSPRSTRSPPALVRSSAGCVT